MWKRRGGGDRRWRRVLVGVACGVLLVGAWGCDGVGGSEGNENDALNQNTNQNQQSWGHDASAPSGAFDGEFGATQGGVQDMTLARSLVDEGQVPPPEAFVVEAMFSEHDLPLTGSSCSNTLCLRAAMGVAPDATDVPAAWLQVGMSSTIDPETFVRPSQTLVAVVDVSGSMGWDYPNQTRPGALTRQLLHAIAPKLDASDQFALVTFGSSSQVALPTVSGADQQAISDAIDALHEDGSTNMEAGIQTAIPVAQAALGQTDAVRMLVFSDYNPNVGATEPTEFQLLVQQAADQDIGVTLFGLGLGLAPSVMKAMSEIRGANAFSATEATEVDDLMADSWPWMVCPLAYDLSVNLEAGPGYQIAASYGFPGEAGAARSTLEVATVFLSRRKGGMLVKLVPTAGGPIDPTSAQLKLDYLTPDGQPRTELLQADYAGQALSPSGQYMPQIGVARATALALLVSGMQRAAELYDPANPTAAVDILQAALNRFVADVAEHQDSAELQGEVTFAQDLLALMQSGAPQGNLYGGGY
jgi:Ca-activated chloride channel family protein